MSLFFNPKTIRPCPSTPHVSVFVWKRISPPPHPGLAHRPHVSGRNGHRKRIFSKTHSRVEIFENAGLSFTCGRTKTEVFEYDDVTHHITSSMTYVPWGMLSCRSSLLGASKSYTRPMSRHFYGLFIFRHILWVPDFHRFSVFMWTSETIRLRCVTMGIFLNTEKTSPFSKNMRILVDGALVIKLCLLLPRPRVIRCQDHLPPTKIWNCFRNLNSLHIK